MKRLIPLILLSSICSANAQESASRDVLAYIERFRTLAMDEMVRTGVPAAIKLAQGIIETQAGSSDLVLRSNNHFGIKCKSGWTGERAYHDDDEKGECFRKYATAEDSWRDHSDYLRSQPRYASLFGLDPTDYAGWARGLKAAGYATDPRYPEKLIRYIENHRLYEHSMAALARMKGGGDSVSDGTTVPSEAVAAQRSDPVVPSREPQQDVMPVPFAADQGPAYGTVFQINGTRAVRAASGTSLLALAEKHGLGISRLLEFNEMSDYVDILGRDRLVYIQRKPRKGARPWHEAADGQTLRDIAASEGVRLESLREYNRVSVDEPLAAGRRVYLQGPAPEDAPETHKAPTPGMLSHRVEAGETLYEISRRYEVDVCDIMRLNALDSGTVVAGSVIRIPAK